ncbi:hypothetical protein [uncultured Flavobacterium sp.]|uniref:hypothetical protein n=1 Tax=uncultured Flavobacterium sp. TaxID=165435 RepID=UPI0025F039AB|nr:hypothetical protein [uncultured Flavobacterium sp.]
MKNYLHLLLLMASMGVFAQADRCGLDNSPRLTDEEAAFLNEYFSEMDRMGFDFTGKKVLILGGSAGSRLCGKQDYFNSIKERIEDTMPIASSPYPLTDEEKAQCGGYDAVLTFWNKVPLTRDKIKRVVRRVAEGIWEVPGA